MAELPDDLLRIVARAGRVIRLAKLQAPAVILVETEDSLRKAIDRHARACGTDPDGWRTRRAADQVEADETFTADDAAEISAMEDEMRRYTLAEPIARERWVREFFHPNAESQARGARLWLDLDTSYRSDLVYAEMEAGRAP